MYKQFYLDIKNILSQYDQPDDWSFYDFFNEIYARVYDYNESDRERFKELANAYEIIKSFIAYYSLNEFFVRPSERKLEEMTVAALALFDPTTAKGLRAEDLETPNLRG